MDYQPNEKDILELDVVDALHGISRLQVKVAENPLAYEDYLSEISDIMAAAAEMKGAITRAMAAVSRNESIKLGGL